MLYLICVSTQCVEHTVLRYSHTVFVASPHIQVVCNLFLKLFDSHLLHYVLNLTTRNDITIDTMQQNLLPQSWPKSYLWNLENSIFLCGSMSSWKGTFIFMIYKASHRPNGILVIIFSTLNLAQYVLYLYNNIYKTEKTQSIPCLWLRSERAGRRYSLKWDTE